MQLDKGLQDLGLRLQAPGSRFNISHLVPEQDPMDNDLLTGSKYLKKFCP